MVAKSKFRSAYDGVGYKHAIDFTNSKTRTKQSFKEECDVNNIMKRYQRDGVIAHRNEFGGNYGDFMTEIDYHSAMNQIAKAQQMFEGLPSSIRNRFNNDPAEYLAFVHDPENKDEMVKLGLMKKPPEGEDKTIKDSGGGPVKGAEGAKAPLDGDGGKAPSEPPKSP